MQEIKHGHKGSAPAAKEAEDAAVEENKRAEDKAVRYCDGEEVWDFPA